MKNILVLSILGLALFSCQEKSDQNKLSEITEKNTAEKEMVRDGVFIHISEGYNDPHKVLMPLKMATMMADDKDVLVYMDIHAVEALVKGAKDLEFEGFESLQTYVKQLGEKNVGVYACPTCLKVAGFSPDDLMRNVQPAQKDKFFDFTKGRIITLDY